MARLDGGRLATVLPRHICIDALKDHLLERVHSQGPLLTLVTGVQQSIAGNDASAHAVA